MSDDKMTGEIAIKMLQHLRVFLDEHMERAKQSKTEKDINVAGFCADIKKELSLEKARIIGKM